ncbi:MAG: glycosyltransferase family 9 protein [Lewinellaceae bacterium]|nr:glycosyltransferase family 9 protein [Lewinellaceae bacterium]
MRILIIQTAFIGDVVLATALVEQLRRCHADAEIDFLLRRGNEGLVGGHPHIRNLLVWDKKQHKYAGLFRLLGQIRRTRYDWVINCQRFAASGLLTAFSGAKHTTGFDKNPFSVFFTRQVKHVIGNSKSPVHEVERNLALIAHLGNGGFDRPKLYPAAVDRQKAQALADGMPYVCMAPTSVWFTKQWPARKWAQLAAQMASTHRIFLLGGKADEQACEEIRQSSGRPEAVINMAGQLSFLESAALIERAAMTYANDSAPIHIASAVNAPVTAVFCSTVPAFGFSPLSDRSYVAETAAPLKCRPCGLHGLKRCPEGHFACAEGIDPAVLPRP